MKHLTEFNLYYRYCINILYIFYANIFSFKSWCEKIVKRRDAQGNNIIKSRLIQGELNWVNVPRSELPVLVVIKIVLALSEFSLKKVPQVWCNKSNTVLLLNNTGRCYLEKWLSRAKQLVFIQNIYGRGPMA